jgi:D-3-phosphoglycerate dehydrogenase
MRVVVTDRPFPGSNPYEGLIDNTDELYTNTVKRTGESIIYEECETEDDVINACRGADIIVTFVAPITETVLDEIGDLDLIIRQGAGYDNIDVQAATERDIPVSNVPDYGSNDVASHGIALALAASHDIVQNDTKLRNNQGWGSSRVLRPVQGGTYGIVGLGRIGRRAVPMARGLNMDVIAYDPLVDDDIFDMVDVEPVSFNELLRRGDCITIHAPMTEETHHMFSTNEFDQMKPSAILVNVARGPIVDTKALVDALEEGEIRAAGLDVYENEPPNASRVLDCEKITCSPHFAGGSVSAKKSKIAIVRDELERALTGETLQNVVNREVFQYRAHR